MKNPPLKIYFAGGLFDAKELGGNLLLARSIEKYSDGRYLIMLPQDGESEVNNRNAVTIRDADFELLFNCDLILANFDGTDLDSGTVVEFCFAKMVDMPALLLRTDFREGGDQGLAGSDPWNLMCSNYPRTKSLCINAMACYHKCRSETASAALLTERFYGTMAEKIVAELDALVTMPSWLPPQNLLPQLTAAVKSIGGTLGERLTPELLSTLAEQKKGSGLF